MKISCLIQEFRAHDTSHPDSKKISEELNRLNEELISHGYAPDRLQITRPVGNDETIPSILCGHSERLAIGLNLIQIPSPPLIQVIKNLRICGDCRKSLISYFNISFNFFLFLDNAIKLIAKIRQCQIIVRDANRVHHFHPTGKCSCNDYF